MTYEFLSRLYCACTDEAAGVPPFSEMYEHISETEVADTAFSEHLKYIPISERDSMEHLQITSCLAYEKQGFINGVRMAMVLSLELDSKGKTVAMEEVAR